jgi:iron complex transport system permease protein
LKRQKQALALENGPAIARKNTRSRRLLLLGLVFGILILIVCAIASIGAGAMEIPPNAIYKAFTAFDGSTEQLVVRTLRVPRTAIAIAVGACLAVAGAIMQGLTRNPLASPAILGINAGAALAVVASQFMFASSSLGLYATFGFLGAGIAAAAVYCLGSLSRGGPTPVRLTIAGAALTALLSSWTTLILILDQQKLEEIRFWLAGSVAGRDMDLFLQIFPYMLLGLTMAFALARQITILTLGEEVATGLGVRTAWVKVAAIICVVLLAGSSVAIAGSIGFIGLIIPHVARFLVGVDYRWLVPYAAILGSILLLLADIAARVAIAPVELPVGVMTALIGGPFFIYLALSKVRK